MRRIVAVCLSASLEDARGDNLFVFVDFEQLPVSVKERIRANSQV